MGYRNKYFEKICKQSQEDLKKWLWNELVKVNPDAYMESAPGYLYYEGTFPVLLTAHMDTVHIKQCDKIQYQWDTKKCQTICSNKNGIGGDDRCGVYMILKILEQIDCSVLFCEDEEVGSIGAHKFVDTELCQSLKGKFKYIIELDRMNSRDAVFYSDDNEEFHKFILKEYWKKDFGSWSDICTLSPALEISSVNFSCGYYRAHTTAEYVVLEEMERNIDEVVKLLKRTDLNAEPFKFIKKTYTSYLRTNYGNAIGGGFYNVYGDYGDYWDDYYGYGYEQKSSKQKTKTQVVDELILEVTLIDSRKFGSSYLMTSGETEDECWKNMFFDNPQLCFDDIVDWDFVDM